MKNRKLLLTIKQEDSMFYTLHRKGVIYPFENSPNQCKAVGHRHYYYHLAVITREVDEQGFVVDHEILDDILQKTDFTGSCENLCEKIFEVIQPQLDGILAYKCKITPKPEGMDAFMEYSWYDDERRDALAMLTTLQL